MNASIQLFKVKVQKQSWQTSWTIKRSFAGFNPRLKYDFLFHMMLQRLLKKCKHMNFTVKQLWRQKVSNRSLICDRQLKNTSCCMRYFLIAQATGYTSKMRWGQYVYKHKQICNRIIKYLLILTVLKSESDSRLQPCALNNGEGKIHVWVPDCSFLDQTQVTLYRTLWAKWIASLRPLHCSPLLFAVFSPSRVFLRPSAPTTTSNSKLATGWSAGRIAALHPIPKRWKQRQTKRVGKKKYTKYCIKPRNIPVMFQRGARK